MTIQHQIDTLEAGLKACLSNKNHHSLLAGLFREIKTGQIVSVHVSPLLGDELMRAEERSVEYYTQKIIETQITLSALRKAEGQEAA